jgi:anti-sigma factor RsiW
MSIPSDIPTERDEIEMLLPWFVTGKLDATDHARVEAFLIREPAMRKQLDLVRDEQDQSRQVNQSITAPRSLSVERGIAYITAKQPLSLKQSSAGLLEKISTFFAMPTSTGVRWAAAAAAVVILAQAATVGTLLMKQSAGGYITATGGTAADGSFAIVKFVDGASAQAIANALTSLNMSITDGPKPGGVFQVRIGPKTLSEPDRAQRVAALRQRPDVIGLVLLQP